MQAIVQDRFGSADVLELRDIDPRDLARRGTRPHLRRGVDRGGWYLMAGLPYPIRLAGYGFRAPRTPSPAPTSPAWSSTRPRSRRGGTACPGDRRLRRPRDLRVQIAKAFDASVTGVCSTSKVDLVRSTGADEVIDYTRDDFAVSSAPDDVILDIGGNSSVSRLRSVLTRPARS